MLIPSSLNDVRLWYFSLRTVRDINTISCLLQFVQNDKILAVFSPFFNIKFNIWFISLELHRLIHADQNCFVC